MAAGSTYTPIATNTLGSATTALSFNSISGSYTDLVLIMNIKGTGTGWGKITFNSDTGTNYSQTELRGNGTTASSGRGTNQTGIQPIGAALFTTAFGFNNIVNIMNYSNTTTYKTVLARGNNANNGTDAEACLWRSTAAITSITITASANQFDTGSSFTLYGIAAA